MHLKQKSQIWESSVQQSAVDRWNKRPQVSMIGYSKAKNQLYNVNSHGTVDLMEHWYLCISSKTARHIIYNDIIVKENYPTAVVSLSDEITDHRYLW